MKLKSQAPNAMGNAASSGDMTQRRPRTRAEDCVTDDHEIPRAILEWLQGFDEPPTVRAQGRTAEESERILKFLETLLNLGAPE